MPDHFFPGGNDKLDYKFDWKAETNGRSDADGDWLQDGDTIQTPTMSISPTTNVTVGAPSTADNSTSVVVWLTFTDATVGAEYFLTNKIITVAGRTKYKTAKFTIV